MAAIARLSGVVAAGLLIVAVGLERFVNAILVGDIAWYASARFIVAVVCVAAGTVLLVVHAVARRPRRRPRRYGGLK